VKDIMNQFSINESQDDSDDDNDYHPEPKEDLSESDFSDLSESEEDVYIFKSDEDEIFNPFAETHANKYVNSTFKSSSKPRNSESMFQNEHSPIKHPDKPNISCEHCGKVFRKMYNLKQHIICVHKIFPKGVAIFKCPVPDCRFVSGNKILFNRHNHNKKIVIVPSKLSCKLCKGLFATKGSLTRHIKRKHKPV
jgi:zinc finger/BTB domain-containing protein 41